MDIEASTERRDFSLLSGVYAFRPERALIFGGIALKLTEATATPLLRHTKRSRSFSADMMTKLSADTHQACSQYVCFLHSSNMIGPSYLEGAHFRQCPQTFFYIACIDVTSSAIAPYYAPVPAPSAAYIWHYLVCSSRQGLT